MRIEKTLPSLLALPVALYAAGSSTVELDNGAVLAAVTAFVGLVWLVYSREQDRRSENDKKIFQWLEQIENKVSELSVNLHQNFITKEEHNRHKDECRARKD